MNEQPKQVKAETLDALCTALGCTSVDLWVFTLQANSSDPHTGKHPLKEASQQ